jgi:hypothetical protein
VTSLLGTGKSLTFFTVYARVCALCSSIPLIEGKGWIGQKIGTYDKKVHEIISLENLCLSFIYVYMHDICKVIEKVRMFV